MHGADLYLACACVHHDRAALSAFDRSFLADVDRHVAGVHHGHQFADEVRQKIREELFVAKDERPGKITNYRGQGPLGGWLRVVAVRTALNLRRGKAPPASLDEDRAVDDVRAPLDPELEVIRRRYQNEFRTALVAAIEHLPPEQRNALRLHYLDGLSLDETATVCRVHRATVARWLARAKEQILADTGRLLQQQLRIGQAELNSVLRLVRSQIDVSLRRVLGGAS